MKYNEKWKCYVSKNGIILVLRGTTNQAGYCGDYGLKIKGQYDRGNGYLYHISHGASISVHRLVWETFNGDIPEGMEIDHIDRNRYNNDLSNLRLVTHKENCSNRNNVCTDERKQRLREAALNRWTNYNEEQINEIRNNMKHGCSKRTYKKRGPYKKEVE